MHQRCRGSSRPTVMGYVAALLAACCFSPGQPDMPRTPPPGSQAPTAEHPSERWAMLDEILTWPALTTAPFPSRGHAPPQFLAEVRAEPRFANAYRESVRGTPLPVGLRVAARHFERSSGAPGPVFLMEKLDEHQWGFAVAGADGRRDSTANLTRCARCHADAPNDHVFGLPRTRTAGTDPDRE